MYLVVGPASLQVLTTIHRRNQFTHPFQEAKDESRN